MDNLSYIKQRFEGNFDVKYKDVNTIIGDGTIVFIDDLCNGQWMMEYLILPLRGFGELKNTSIKYPNDLLEKVLDISATGMATDLEDALMHVLSGDVILILKDIYVTPNTNSIKCFADNLFISFPPISKYKLSLFYYSQKNEY